MKTKASVPSPYVRLCLVVMLPIHARQPVRLALYDGSGHYYVLSFVPNQATVGAKPGPCGDERDADDSTRIIRQIV